MRLSMNRAIQRITGIALSLLMVLILIGMPDETVRADAGVSISVSKTSLKIGESVTVTVSVPSGYAANGYVSSGGAGIWSSSADKPFSIGDAGGQANSASFTYTATAAGSGTFTAVVTVMGDIEGNPIAAGSPSASVSVSNPSSGGNSGGGGSEKPGNNQGENPGEQGEEPEKSVDNFLASITLSSGSLSPEFYYATTKYTATVDNSVTSVNVSATTSHPKAKITSLSGNTDLQVGSNTITIEVKAENGSTRTYTIEVTREAEGVSEAPSEQQEPGPSEFGYNGGTYVPVEEIPEESIPEHFSKETVYLGDKEFPSLQFDNGELQLLYLKNQETEAEGLFVYDRNANAVYPFVVFGSEAGFVIALLPAESLVPEGYAEISLSIEGKGVVTAYQRPGVGDTEESIGLLNWLLPEKLYAAEPEEADYYLIYCMNQSGETGWYSYDNVEGTYQRYLSREGAAASGIENSGDDGADGYTALADEYDAFEKRARIIGAAMAFIIAVLLVTVILLIVSKMKKREDDQEIEVYDLDDADTPAYVIPEETDLEETVELTAAEKAEEIVELSAAEVSEEPVELSEEIKKSATAEESEPAAESTAMEQLEALIERQIDRQIEAQGEPQPAPGFEESDAIKETEEMKEVKEEIPLDDRSQDMETAQGQSATRTTIMADEAEELERKLEEYFSEDNTSFQPNKAVKTDELPDKDSKDNILEEAVLPQAAEAESGNLEIVDDDDEDFEILDI